ncbi:MAG: 50S ribosomal protein L23 [Patescibacteria group bacterium]
MSLFDRFKKQQQAPAAKKPAAAPKQPQHEKTVREEVAGARPEVAKQKKAGGGQYAHHVLIRPVISEKSTRLHSSNQYVFIVAPAANKIMIQKAIFETYNARPKAVKIIRLRGKVMTSRGMYRGVRKDYKKAVVVMPKGVTLPIYESV